MLEVNFAVGVMLRMPLSSQLSARSNELMSVLQSEGTQNLLNSVPEWVVDVGILLVVVLVVGFLSGRVVQFLRPRISRQIQQPTITRDIVLNRLGQAFMVLTAVYVGAIILGYQPTGVITSLGIFSVVIGLILAPIIGTMISGILLLLDEPYEVDDLIKLENQDEVGFIEQITLRHTEIYTLDKTHLVIPNKRIRQRDIINYSKEDVRTRRSLDFSIAYESDTERACEYAEEAAGETEMVISGGTEIQIRDEDFPAEPVCHVNEFGDNGVKLTLRYWITEPHRELPIKSQIQRKIQSEFDQEGIQIPYPHSHLWFDENSGSADVRIEVDE